MKFFFQSCLHIFALHTEGMDSMILLMLGLWWDQKGGHPWLNQGTCCCSLPSAPFTTAKKSFTGWFPSNGHGILPVVTWHLDQQGSPHASCKSHCTCPTNRGLSDDHAFKQGTVRAQMSGFLEEGEDDCCDPNSIACLTSKQDLSAIILGLLLLLGILYFCVDAQSLLALECNHLLLFDSCFYLWGIFFPNDVKKR